MRYIASCSFGKDSLATILLALEHGEPLDEAVYCEVMFDADTSNAYQRALGRDVVQYIGIAFDEQDRLLRLKEGKTVSLLEKYHKTEDDAVNMCRIAGLYSPIYSFTRRGGCFFCPNAKLQELRHLYLYHPNLWARLLECQKAPNKVTERFNRTDTITEIDALFQWQDQQYSLFDGGRLGAA